MGMIEPLPAFLTSRSSTSSTTTPERIGNTNLLEEDGEMMMMIRQLVRAEQHHLSDEALIKVCRQLDFWSHVEQGIRDDPVVLRSTAQRILAEATMQRHSTPSFHGVPTVRFGRTELPMPIITVGSMRFQYSWLPSHVPILADNRRVVAKSQSQLHLKEMVRLCFQYGLTHFETARLYGTSEWQLVKVLQELLDANEIRREDFIFQTKIAPQKTVAQFAKLWDATWQICAGLGHIDLFSFHCVSSPDQIRLCLAGGDDDDDYCYGYVKQLQNEGKIKHIGFSTHGYAAGIMTLIESGRFSYVNLHYHFVGSYHATGTDDTRGGQGLLSVVQRAKELDMGVFIISPFDKGGKMYRPSKRFCRLLGPQWSPLSFVLLHAWHTAGAHTASIGFSRLADLDDALAAAQLYQQQNDFSTTALAAAELRLTQAAIDALGPDWHDQGLLQLPHPYEPSTKLLGLGHMVWLHNLCTAWGLYEFSRDRYDNMLKCHIYNDQKSFDDNAHAMNTGNMGRSYDATVDLTEALSRHFDPVRAQQKMAELHAWMTTTTTTSTMIPDDWQPAYDLQTWPEFANTAQNLAQPWRLLLDSWTFGWFQASGGPNQDVADLARAMRAALLLQ
jgi:uncharacterized protein